MKKPTKPSRQKARQFAVQALYQWQLSHATLSALQAEFSKQNGFASVDRPYWQELVCEGIARNESLKEAMQPFLSRSVEKITPVELAILTVAFYEFIHRPEIPYRVIINEAIDLAKCFGAIDSHKFINGVLDAAAKKLRAHEIDLGNKKPN